MSKDILVPGVNEGEAEIRVVSATEALTRIEASSHSEAQKSFMEMIVLQGKSFPHDFGSGEVMILDVSRFFNHGVDVNLMEHLGAELAQGYEGDPIDVVLTVPSGGNIIAYEVASQLGVNRLVYARKNVNVIHEKKRVVVHCFAIIYGRRRTRVGNFSWINKPG